MQSGAENVEQAARLLATGQPDAAVAFCRNVLSRDPRNAPALDLLGMVARLRGNHPEALRLFNAAVAADSKSALLRLHKGLALRACGRTDEAISEFRAAVALDTQNPECLHQLGNALKARGRNAEAMVNLQQASRLAPHDATIWLNLGVAQFESSQLDEALDSFRRAIALEPNTSESHNILGVLLLERGEVTAAIAALHESLRIRPNGPAHDNLARALRSQGRVEEAISGFRAALTLAPNPETHSNLLYTLNFSDALPPEQILQEHRAWDERHTRKWQRTSQPCSSDWQPEKRIRVGFVSPDLASHAVSFFVEPLFSALDRTRVDVVCYSDVMKPDAVTERLRSLATVWRETAFISDDQLDTLIRRDKIDVLVDLAGHTGRNRLLVFARKPAPVQVSWLGYPNTTGVSGIGFRITDGIADPVGVTDAWHSETLVRLRNPFLCYKPPQHSPAVGLLPSRESGRITFGSFSNFPKLSERCLDVWAAILARVPRSRLLLKSRGLEDPGVRAALDVRLQQRGVAPDRVRVHGRLLPVSEHLALYNEVDIALDPFPYNGTTTTCEALWMGVPTIVLAGRAHVSRVGVSLLTSMGADDWVAASEEEYIDRACMLAGAPDRLAEIRATLRERMLRSSLCDAPGFAVEFETALRKLWRTACTNFPSPE